MPEPDRIPLAHSVRYVARGLPEVPNKYGDGVLAPSEITLTYRAAPDSQLGRVHAYVAGRLWVNGAEIPLLSGGLYGQHYDDGLDGWPDWLAAEARLHDPKPPVDQAAVLRKAADLCDDTGANYTAMALNDHAAAAFDLMEKFRYLADEAEYQATGVWPPCNDCDTGEPCDGHERMRAHAEGEHAFCGPDCKEA